jgi:hypothetical protein
MQTKYKKAVARVANTIPDNIGITVEEVKKRRSGVHERELFCVG